MIICVTGYHGCGKTTVSKMLGFRVIHADDVGRKVFKQKKEEIKKLMGTLDRKEIRAKIFSDPKMLLKFNKIMHPPMVSAIREKVRGENMVIDAALYHDLQLDKLCNKVIVVIRNKYKVMRSLGEDKEEVDSIMKRQKMPRKTDFVIINNGTKAELKKKAKEIKKKLNI